MDDPDEIHRAAFQHYAMELFETIRDSDIPPLEGFAFGMLANIHLQFIYDEGPSTEQIQEEIDRLELGPYERLRFVMGYAPYAPKVDEDEDDGFGYYSDLLVAEVDHYRDALADYEPENEADELELQVLLVLFDLLRAHLRSVGEDEFDSTSIEIYQDTLERVQSPNIASYFEEESEEAAHLIPDMLEVMCHIAIHNDSDDEGTRTTHLEGLYSVLDEYGLGQEPIEEFIDYCQEIRDEFQAGEQMEEIVEDRLEEVFGDVEDDGLTRTALVQVQYDFLDEMKSLASSFATGLMTESNRLTDFILDCGESLAKAENPFFAAAWYAFATQIFRMFAPEAESTKELEEAFHEQAARRKEYEKQLDTPIVEMEEFEIGEFELPDVVDEIAARESNEKIFPEPDTDDKET